MGNKQGGDCRNLQSLLWVFWMGSWLVRSLCYQLVLANTLGTLDAEDLHALAEVFTSSGLAMELSRQSSKWVSVLMMCLYFQCFLCVVMEVC